MKRILKHIRKKFIAGLLAIIPLGLTIFAIKFFYILIDNRLMGWVDNAFGVSIPGLGIILIILLLYFLGVFASNLLGKKLINLFEQIIERIPIIKTTYNLGKQVSSAFTLPSRDLFKRVVLVDYLKEGMWTIGFVTGDIIDHTKNDMKLLKVYIPTPPNPTSGTIVLVKETETRDPGWSIEQAIKMVISAGIIGPTEISKKKVETKG
ncbi:hypothetical protein BVX98_07440 [bacterium F11]|nr:hypothetical protein BVX98_07440 [bacterium F11]